MKRFEIYVHPDDDAYEKTKIVPDSFNIFAFIFGTFWLLYQRLWIHSLVLLSLLMLASWCKQQGFLPDANVQLFYVATSIWVGFHGYYWVGHRWKTRGYRLHTIVLAPNKDMAYQRFLDQQMVSSS